MAILVGEDTRVIVQGITGSEGSFHAEQMLQYGTDIVGGVTPGKGGEEVAGKPVFDTVDQAVEATGANASVIFVPPPFAADAAQEAVDADLDVAVTITEGIPILDALETYSAMESSLTTLIGPNCPGILTVDETKLGIMPGHIFKKGPVGVISRSGTLTYEAVDQLSRNGLGQSTCIGIGGDPIIGTTFIDLLVEFEDDPDTKAVVLIGEIGGTDEQEAAEYIEDHMSTPVVAFISGRTAPEGKRMGHAGAIVSGGSGTAEAKVEAFESVGVTVPETLPELVDETREVLEEEGVAVGQP